MLGYPYNKLSYLEYLPLCYWVCATESRGSTPADSGGHGKRLPPVVLMEGYL